MNRDDIITKLARDGTIDKMATTFRSYIKASQTEDFKQEIWLIICELPDDKLIKLYNDGTLEFYLLTIIKNQCTNIHSSFNNKYNKITTVPLDEDKESI